MHACTLASLSTAVSDMSARHAAAAAQAREWRESVGVGHRRGLPGVVFTSRDAKDPSGEYNVQTNTCAVFLTLWCLSTCTANEAIGSLLEHQRL